MKGLEYFVQKNMAGQKTKQAKSKLKYLNRIKRLPPPKDDAKTSSINMQSSGRSYAHVMEVKDLASGYGSDPVVSDVTFDLYRGEKVGMIGRNGSGKTTTIKLLLGLLFPTSGEALVFGQDASNVQKNERIGFLPEESYLYKFLNAEETLDFYGRLFNISDDVRRDRVERCDALA